MSAGLRSCSAKKVSRVTPCGLPSVQLLQLLWPGKPFFRSWLGHRRGRL